VINVSPKVSGMDSRFRGNDRRCAGDAILNDTPNGLPVLLTVNAQLSTLNCSVDPATPSMVYYQQGRRGRGHVRVSAAVALR
jgi:hypothetical protein